MREQDKARRTRVVHHRRVTTARRDWKTVSVRLQPDQQKIRMSSQKRDKSFVHLLKLFGELRLEIEKRRTALVKAGRHLLDVVAQLQRQLGSLAKALGRIAARVLQRLAICLEILQRRRIARRVLVVAENLLLQKRRHSVNLFVLLALSLIHGTLEIDHELQQLHVARLANAQLVEICLCRRRP